MQDEAFYEAVTDGTDISIDFNGNTIHVDGREFPFQLSQMEKELFDHGGIASAFRHFGNRLFEAMTSKGAGADQKHEHVAGPHAGLQW